MPDQPLVSIAAISYNTSKYVVQTLESIRSQTYPNIELVIVDDCSTDNSVVVIDEWLKTYHGPYKFIKHEINKGVCATYNSGLSNSSGIYFTVVDTDDMLLPEKTAKQVAILETSGERVAAVYSDAYVMDEQGLPSEGLFIQKHRQFSEIPSGNIYETLLQGNYLPCMTLLIKKAVFGDIGGYDENLVYEDYDMWLRIAQKYEILFSDFISCRYRIRKGSLSFTVKNWKLSDAKIFLKHVGAPLPMDRLKNIARDVYVANDKETLPYIKELAIKTGSRYILASWLLHELNFSPEKGELVLLAVKETNSDCIPKEISNTPERLFINEVVPVVPVALMHEIAWQFYAEGDKNKLPLLKELAIATDDRYLLAVYLLGKFDINCDAGEIILGMINQGIALGWYSGIVGKDSNEIELFTGNIVPAIPFELLKSLSRNAYFDNNNILMLLVKELTRRTRNRYLKTVWLLWKYKIKTPIGAIIMARIDNYIRTDKSMIYIDICIYKDIFEARKL